LDEILIPAWSRLRSDDTGKCRHIDEVHPLIACTRKRKRSAMYLKREPPKSLPWPPSAKDCSFTRGRPARTSPSTFLFLPIHFSNSPGTMAVPTPRLAEGPSKPAQPKTIGYRVTVPVRSFRGAQSRRKRTARRGRVYRLRPGGVSTKKRKFFHFFGRPSKSQCKHRFTGCQGGPGRRTQAIILSRS